MSKASALRLADVLATTRESGPAAELAAAPIVNILIVDDRPENLLALEVSLDALGQRIVRANSGEAALRAVLDDEFAVILMDIRMPGLDGFETLALLRQRERSRHIPIIFLTAYAEEQSIIRSDSSGAVDCLAKPFDPAALRAKVAVFVHLRQKEIALQAAHAELEHRVAARTRELQAEIERRTVVEQRLRDLAHRDALTGLANRTLLLDHLNHAVARWHRRAHPTFAVLMMDLDKFKAINDSLGHLAGDKLLSEVAARLERCLRSVDTASRLGGDEFAMLVDGIDESRDASRTAARIHAALAAPILVDDREVTISGSIGIAMMDGRYTRGEELLRDADIALYRAKEAGRSRSQLFDQAMHDAVLAQLRGEAELRLALEQSQLVLHYQPIVELATERTVGFEALVRWQHPTRGELTPAAFLELADDAGLLRPLGRWVIDTACEQLAAWHAAGHTALTLALNVAPSQLTEPGFAAFVASALHRHALAPDCLVLEIAEAGFMPADHVDAAGGTRVATIHELRELGVGLLLDNFGAGLSSIPALRALGLTRIKLAPIFMTPTNSSLLAPIVALAQAIGVALVATRIETDEQLAAVTEAACILGQGYRLARPLTASAAQIHLHDANECELDRASKNRSSDSTSS